jgi:FixJ family two-component response regulator
MKAGAFDFLTKPLERDVLLATIRQALERRRAALLQESEMQAACDRQPHRGPRLIVS